MRSWSLYGTMVRAILFLKFENIDPLGELFARMLAEWPSWVARLSQPT